MTRNTKHAFRDFTDRLKLLIQKRPDLITITLSNIFTMRLIGNKTHGDLAEIGIMEFVNQFLYAEGAVLGSIVQRTMWNIPKKHKALK
jgi:hypothetical protein